MVKRFIGMKSWRLGLSDWRRQFVIWWGMGSLIMTNRTLQLFWLTGVRRSLGLLFCSSAVIAYPLKYQFVARGLAVDVWEPKLHWARVYLCSCGRGGASSCLVFLEGRNLTIVTDHRPLVRLLWDRTLQGIVNPRLFKLKEKKTRQQVPYLWELTGPMFSYPLLHTT